MRTHVLILICSIFTTTAATSAEVADSSKGSNCSEWTEIRVDKMTGEETMAARQVLLVSQDERKGLAINMFKWKSDTLGFGPHRGKPNFLLALVIVVAGGGGCVDKGDQINILFRDGSRMTLKNERDFNCKAKSTIYFRPLWNNLSNNAETLRSLIEKEIEAMRVWTTDTYVEENFSPEQSAAFRNTIRCLSMTTN